MQSVPFTKSYVFFMEFKNLFRAGKREFFVAAAEEDFYRQKR